MLSTSTVCRRNVLQRKQYFKPLTLYWRSQRTEARALDSQETFHGVRAFEDIPEPNSFKFMYDLCTKTERFTKGFKVTERLFEELGPVYKERWTLTPLTSVHVIEPEDIEKVFRAEGKYPRRPIIDVWLEYRKRRNYFPGLVLV